MIIEKRKRSKTPLKISLLIKEKKARKKIKKMKALLPTLRERKRYVSYEILSEKPITDSKKAFRVIKDKMLDFLGEFGYSEAGIILMEKNYDQKLQRGVIRVNYKYVDKLKASLTLVEDIENNRVMVVTNTTSGMLKKATEGKYIAG